MCTVSFIPLKAGCLITSNRDETIHRPAAIPPNEKGGGGILYPKDPVGGGTWIASGNKATVCLFNGAFEPHQRKNSYRASRGIIPIEFFKHENASQFASYFDFEGIEPFSIVIFQNGNLHEIKWDEKNAHLIKHDHRQAHIWASVTLYSEEVRERRKRMFNEWLSQDPILNQESVIGFHTSEKTDLQNGLLIKRDNGLQTVSVTSVERKEGAASNMVYRDLVKNELYQKELRH